MATTTITALPAQTVVEPDNLIIVQDGPDTKKMPLSLLTSANDAAVNGHINDPSAAHTASAVSATASGTGVTSATVQGQLFELANSRVINGGSVASITVMTQAAYDALATKVPTTLYILT